MAKLINGSKQVDINQDDDHLECCQKVDVPLSCEDGKCGTCLSEVLSGMENLTPITEKEKLFGLEENERLMCQCRLTGGEVEIDC